MASDIIRTAWGSTHSVSFAPHEKVESGENWEVWKRVNNSYWAAAFNGEKTLTNTGGTGAFSEIVQWAKDNAAPIVPEEAFLIVKSAPRLAAVLIDGEMTGKETNTSPILVDAGSHRVTLHKEGYESIWKTITAEEGVTKTVEFNLIKEEEEKPKEPPEEPSEEPQGPVKGRLIITTTPSPAGVVIVDVGTFESPTDYISLEVGKTYHLEILEKDSEKLTDNISLSEAKDYVEHYNLVPAAVPPEERPPLWDLVQLIWGDEAEGIWKQFFGWYDAIKPILDLVIDEIPTPDIDGVKQKPIPIFIMGKAELAAAAKVLPNALRVILEEGAENTGERLASKIVASGLKHPDDLTRWGKELTEAEISKIYVALTRWSAREGDEAFNVMQRLVLPPMEKAGFTHIATTPANLKRAILWLGGIVGAKEMFSWFAKELPELVSFPLQDAIRKGKWEEAHLLLPAYKAAVEVSTRFLRITGFEALINLPLWQMYADGMDAVAASYERQIEKGLAEPEEKTILRFEGTPEIVEITAAGIGWSGITPYEVEVPAGNVAYSISAPDYKTKEGNIFISEGQTKTINYILEPTEEEGPEVPPEMARIQFKAVDATTGALVLANWTLNGNIIGTTKTHIILDIKPDDYELLVEAFNYKPYTDAFSVKEGETFTQTYDLTKISEAPPEELKGQLQIYSEPQATITIAGHKQKDTPASYELDQGNYSVGAVPVVNPDKYYTVYPKTAIVKGGETSVMSFIFSEKKEEGPEVPKEKTGTLTISTFPVGATVEIAGEETKTTKAVYTLEEGTYEVHLGKVGFKSEDHRIYLNAGEDKKLSARLEPITEEEEEEELGRVDISSEPAGAKILINGKFTDKWTTGYIYLRPGTYMLRLEKSGFLPWEQMITIPE